MFATYRLIAKQVLTGAASTVTFSSIPSTGFTDLKLLVSGRATINLMYVTFNGSTSGYSYRYMEGSSTTYTGSGFTSQPEIHVVNVSGTSTSANSFGLCEINIPNYASTSMTKVVSSSGGAEDNTTVAYMTQGCGLWGSTAAISSITLYPYVGAYNFVAGTSFSLYGITKA